MLDTVGLFERIRKALGIDEPVEIARFLGVTKQTVYRWRDGEPPKLETLGTIAAQKQTSFHWLLTGQGEEKVVEAAGQTEAEKLLNENSLPEVFNQLFDRLNELEKELEKMKKKEPVVTLPGLAMEHNTDYGTIVRITLGDTHGIDPHLVNAVRRSIESHASEIPGDKRIKNK
jgi:transcriptional regulator with XRE-family HTH domain